MINKRLLTLMIDGVPQTNEDLLAEAAKDGVAFGSTYLSEALSIEVEHLYNDQQLFCAKQVDELIYTEIDALIDMAAYQAIRDLAVGAAVLKNQIAQNPARADLLKEMLFDIKRTGEKEKIQFKEIRAKYDLGEYIFDLDSLKSATPTVQTAAFELLKAGAEGYAQREDISDKLETAFDAWIDEDKIWGKYSETEDVFVRNLESFSCQPQLNKI
jgi:hypothetical protein